MSTPLTPAQIDALAGRELDAEVERAVFGRATRVHAAFYDPTNTRLQVETEPGKWLWAPRYSADIAEAWKLAEWVEAKEYGKVRVTLSHYHSAHCYACWGPGLDGEADSGQALYYTETAAEAICKAVLRAVHSEVTP